MAILNNTSFRLLTQGMDAVWEKQKVISQNIANADTPGYKAKTVNFKTVLSQKCSRPEFHDDKDNGINIETYITTQENSNQLLDGNNVNVDKEMIDLADARNNFV